MKKPRALVLLSGGLDSILAVRTLQEENVKVTGLSFKSCFFDSNQAKRASKNLGIPLRIVDISKALLALVKKPKYGYGKGKNPCIDCHLLMLKRARKIMEDEGFDFVATGEVLGERPMSQNMESLKLIERESGLEGFLVRPLSAKLLGESVPEINGLIRRQKLFAISGRSRKKQLALAKKWKLKDYPSPAGGCILTDPIFSIRIKELLDKSIDFSPGDALLLKVGRHFWEGKTKIVVGRNHKENLKLKRLAKIGDVLLDPSDLPGPTVLVRFYGKARDLGEAKRLLKKYTKTKTKNLKYKIFKK